MAKEPPRYPEIGELLREARERRGMTQAQMAERLGLSQVRISKMESGSLPRTEDVRTVAREYRVDPEQLLPRRAAS